MSGIAAVAWERARLSEALVALAREGRLDPSAAHIPEPVSDSPTVLAAWMEATARLLGFAAQRSEVPYAGLGRILMDARLAVVPVSCGSETRYVALAGRGVALTPDFKRARVNATDLRRATFGALEDAALLDIDPLLERIGLPASRRRLARRALLVERLGTQRIPVWLLRQPVTAPWRRLLLRPHWLTGAAALLAAHVARLALFICAWWLIASTALSGRLEPGWLTAWVLLLVTLTAFHMATVWLQARLAIGFGALLKQRLLAGALRLDPEFLLTTGAGQLLGRVLESEAVESLALAGGFAGLVALLEMGAAAAILLAGGEWVTAALLAVWTAAALVLAHRYFDRARTWTRTRLDLTNALVERMVGHRTRLAQESPERWHEAEDQELAEYLEVSRARDRAEAALSIVIPRGWLLIGIASLAPVFLETAADSGVALAVGLGGLLLAYQAFRRLAAAAWQLIDAKVAGDEIAPLLASARAPEPLGSPAHASAPSPRAGLDGEGLVYRYPEAHQAVLRGTSLRLRQGERAVLLGASGGGKSTLAAVLAGLRTPQSGLLLSGGLDRATLGAQGWLRRVVLAPQFHQNHVITAPLFFNLVLGRPGPLAAADERECLAVCEELGLGPLIEKMPGGLQQIVGETGWQLSQGERSLVFLARALLQGSDVVILDESFGALDPETLESVVECVTRRAPALLVIAHP